MDRGTYWTALGIGLLVVAGGAYYHYAGPAGEAVQPAQAEAPAAASAVTVEARRVTVDTVLEDLRTVGTLEPNESLMIAPEIPGRIESIGFAEGEEVEAGAVLVALDAAILRAEMAKAQSDLTLTAANHERAATLAQRGTGTLRARDEAIAAHRAAQANVALAEARLERTTITAPFSGVMGLHVISVGAYVTPGDRLVELSDIDPIKVDFRVPELALASLHAGQSVQVTVDAVPGSTFTGEVYAIDPVVDANGRAVRLRARIPNHDKVLRPGLFARVQLVLGQRENAVLIPESAVFAERDKRLVYRVVDGQAVLTEIKLGQRRPGQVEVLAGLGPDDVVITAGQQQVRDGSLVEVVEVGAGT